jgi:hypothetical protein
MPVRVMARTCRSSQAEVCPARQAAQVPSAKLGSMTTRWPTSRPVTPGPVATMSPPPSWPNTHGMPGTSRVPS